MTGRMTGRMTEEPSVEKKCADGALLAARHLRKSFAGPSRMWPAEWWTGGGAIDELDGTRGEASRVSDDFKAHESQGQGTSAGLDAAARAVDDVSLTVAAGETLAVVGESGSGKTTLARMLLRLIEPDKPKHGLQAPEICFAGHDLLKATGARLRALRRQMQMIFQDPVSSLDPRMRVAEIVGEPLEIHQPCRLGRCPAEYGKGRNLGNRGTRRLHHAALPTRIFRRPAAANGHSARAGATAKAGGGR